MAQPVSARVAVNKAKGRLGGLKTAEKYGKDFLVERAEKGGNAVRRKFGVEYFRHISRLRKRCGPKPKNKKEKDKKVLNEMLELGRSVITKRNQ